MVKQDTRKFVPKVGCVSTAGYLDGPGARERAGLPRGGPAVVITDKGSYRVDAATKEIVCATYHPGLGVEEIRNSVSWPIRFAKDIHQTKPPTPEELRVLRRSAIPSGFSSAVRTRLRNERVAAARLRSA